MKHDSPSSGSAYGPPDISAVLRLLGEVASAGSVEEVLPALLDGALALTGADVGAIFVEDGDDVVLRHQHNIPEALLQAAGRRPKSDPVVQAAIRSVVPLDNMALGAAVASALRSMGLRHAWTIPLRIGGDWFGFVNVAATGEEPLSAAGLDALPVLAAEMGLVLERLQVKESLRQAQREYEEVFNATSEGIAIYDAQTGAIIDVNRALMEMHGFDDKEAALLVGPGELGQGKPPFSQVEAAEWFRKACVEGPQVFEWLGSRKSGESFWEEVSLRRSEIAGQDRVLSVIRDITERKEAEKERRRLEAQMHRAQRLESLGTLAGGVAHDFNNLLTGILGNASLLSSEPPGDSDAREAIFEIERAARNAAELVRQMLAYAGKETPVTERIDLRHLVDGMHHLLEATVSKKATLVYELGLEPSRVEADPGQLRQVFVNLVTNASEALAGESGTITIRTGVGASRPAAALASRPHHAAESGWSAYLEVSDTGQGMNEETLERLFDPFFTTKFLGRGLGMAAVLGIVQGHQGRVEAQSEPGRGTTVRVVLPAVVEQQPGAPEGEDPAGSEATERRVVLLVDDEGTVRRIGRRMLERLGYTVVAASTGGEALEVFGATPDRFWCVLLDVSMPDLSGDEVLARMRELRPEVRAVICSGHDAGQVRDRFASQLPAGFLRKPYDFIALRQSLAQLEDVPL